MVRSAAMSSSSRKSFATFLFTCILASGCATGSSVGVRAEFQERRVATIVVAPVHASSRFGNPSDEWSTILERYETEVVTELQSMGFRVIEPVELREQLVAARAWSDFEDVVAFRRDLSGYFEPDRYQREPREVLLLRSLAASDTLPSNAILFTEVVYESDGMCRADARDHNEHAEVWVRDSIAANRIDESPCVVSHFQAKLVDAATGKTMWHNRLLREVRVEEISIDARLENIDAAVAGTLGGAYGVVVFAPRPSAIAAGQ